MWPWKGLVKNSNYNKIRYLKYFKLFTSFLLLWSIDIFLFSNIHIIEPIDRKAPNIHTNPIFNHHFCQTSGKTQIMLICQGSRHSIMIKWFCKNLQTLNLKNQITQNNLCLQQLLQKIASSIRFSINLIIPYLICVTLSLQ